MIPVGQKSVRHSADYFQVLSRHLGSPDVVLIGNFQYVALALRRCHRNKAETRYSSIDSRRITGRGTNMLFKALPFGSQTAVAVARIDVMGQPPRCPLYEYTLLLIS